MPRKRKIQIGIGLLVVIILGGTLLVNRYFNIFAAENDITNTATLYYTDENGVQQSVQSNMVVTTVETVPASPSPSVPPQSHTECINQACVTVDTVGEDQCQLGNDSFCQTPPESSVNIQLALEGRNSVNGQPDYSSTGTTLKVFEVDSTTAIFEKSAIQTSASGSASNIAVTGLTEGQNYDFRIKVNTYLVKKLANVQFTNAMPLDFEVLLAGNLDNQENVNIYDFQIMADDWGEADSIANIDKQDTVNIYDFSILADNWGKSDQ